MSGVNEAAAGKDFEDDSPGSTAVQVEQSCLQYQWPRLRSDIRGRVLSRIRCMEGAIQNPRVSKDVAFQSSRIVCSWHCLQT